ncbi:hypothetical protein SUGI_0199750 [Cryptomeria japonica]|uniref:myb-related protein 308 n=1 Tax=Cryptomeria japonica TaxID=3369 RepID=UPI0024089439|nr:myb-related protein 308 [Cryptomeria japonica]GLJ12880.1 hypothetical protein SUGI_0199750 [Cryptomeria japonica]
MGRSPCCEKAHTNKGAWSKQEDETLIAYIQAHGEGCWRTLPKAAGLQRCGKSCRLRWINYLRPDLKRGNFTPEEDELIIKLHSILGNKWSLIAGKLPGRTDNEIKNYWNTHIKKKLLEKGMDPYTHCPIVTSASNSSSSNDNTPCHLNKPSRHVAVETFTDFFQQQAISSSPMVSSYPTALLDDDDNVNLELSITLPSLNTAQGSGTAASASSLTFSSCNDEIFYNGEATSSNGNFTKQESVCCHIGLHTIGGSCCCCSG